MLTANTELIPIFWHCHLISLGPAAKSLRFKSFFDEKMLVFYGQNLQNHLSSVPLTQRSHFEKISRTEELSTKEMQ